MGPNISCVTQMLLLYSELNLGDGMVSSSQVPSYFSTPQLDSKKKKRTRIWPFFLSYFFRYQNQNAPLERERKKKRKHTIIVMIINVSIASHFRNSGKESL